MRCTRCAEKISARDERCPHCGEPLTVPNVRAAEDPNETTALDARYRSALQQVPAVAKPTVRAFEDATTGRSQAVFNRWATELARLAVSDREMYASFYQLVGAETRSPSDNRWDAIREAVDSRLFNYYKEHIRFAALTLDGRGLTSYGDCSVLLKETMIATRASVFEENSVVFMERHNVRLTGDLPIGFRAPWMHRGRLAVAKLAGKLRAGMTDADFSALLLHNGTGSGDDDFIEVHIYGPLTIKAVKSVHLTNPGGTGVRIKTFRHRLEQQGIPLTTD